MSLQEALYVTAGAHDTMRSIASVLSTAPKAEQPALARILAYELERHARFVRQPPLAGVDPALDEALRRTRELMLLQVDAVEFEPKRQAIAQALDRHIEDEERRMQAMA